ncbi:MAG: hypothetical protein IT258_07375 [Saprospiraceae bacterium]|nr:hypothetical protein [Saprospiraceae bacterium]
MSTTNSFKQIMEEDELRFPTPPEIEEHVLGSLQILSMMGQAMELYIPKVFEMFILTLGGTIKELDTAVKNELPEGSTDPDTEGQTPGMAGDVAPDDNNPTQ